MRNHPQISCFSCLQYSRRPLPPRHSPAHSAGLICSLFSPSPLKSPLTPQWSLQSLPTCPGGCPWVTPHHAAREVPRKLTSTCQQAWTVTCRRTMLAPNTDMENYMDMLISLKKEEEHTILGLLLCQQ